MTDLTIKLCRQLSVFEKDGSTFTDLISKILISDAGSDKKATTVIFSDLSLLTILIRYRSAILYYLLFLPLDVSSCPFFLLSFTHVFVFVFVLVLPSCSCCFDLLGECGIHLR